MALLYSSKRKGPMFVAKPEKSVNRRLIPGKVTLPVYDQRGELRLYTAPRLWWLMWQYNLRTETTTARAHTRLLNIKETKQKDHKNSHFIKHLIYTSNTNCTMEFQHSVKSWHAEIRYNEMINDRDKILG